MKHPYQPEVPMMMIYATPNEMIAVGAVITQHLNWIERTAQKTKDQLEMIALLRSFQGRVVAHAQHQPMTPPGSREV
jgi:hypothetical protein